MGAAAGVVAGIAGAAINAFGAYEGGQAASKAAAYQAQVAKNNAQIARQNAAWTEASGEARMSAEGMKSRAVVGNIKAAQGASNIDVNTGSAANVRTAASELGELDAMTIRSNSAREAYGYEVKAVSDTAQSGLLEAESKQAATAGDISAPGTFLTGASSAGSKYASWSLGAPDRTGGAVAGSDSSGMVGVS